MRTHFTPEQLSDPEIASSNVELSACLQCDYCINNCPTHQLLGDEWDSPRGRIFLIKEMLEKAGRPEKNTVDHLDRCLYCLACMSTCPSSVHYMHLVDHARGYIEKNYRRPLGDRMLRWALAEILPHPKRFRLAMRGAQMLRPFSFALSGKLRNLVAFTPEKLPLLSPNDKPQVFPAIGQRRRRVALMTGCVQKTLNTHINDATVRILRRHGCEVVIAQDVGCCGALTQHMGKHAESQGAAAANIRAWMGELHGEGLDAIVINTSGCGTMIKDYGYMFRNGELADDAQRISGLAKDISEVLSELDLSYKFSPGLRVVYHATCSLQFGQRIRFLPKKLLKAGGFTVLEPRDSNTCCGFAGTYKLTQPDISDQLKQRKINTLLQAAPDAIVAGNIGCMLQIGSGTQVPVVHTVELLDWVTGGPMPAALKSAASQESQSS